MQKKVKILFPVLLVSIVMVKCSSGYKNDTKFLDTTKATDSIQRQYSADREKDSLQKTKATADWLLVPGVSAGMTVINGDAAGVYKRLGPPDGGDAAMMKAVAFWYSHHDSTAHSTAIYTAVDAGNDPAARIKLIRITSPAFKTKEGIQPSSSLAFIQKKYNNLKKTETYKDAGKVYVIYDSLDGIAFEISHEKKCVAIVIHEPGKYVYGTHPKFGLTNKYN